MKSVGLPKQAGSIGIWRWPTGFGSSSARSTPFELSFWYVRLEAKMELGSEEKFLKGHFSC
jgi:hypothetical protein